MDAFGYLDSGKLKQRWTKIKERDLTITGFGGHYRESIQYRIVTAIITGVKVLRLKGLGFDEKGLYDKAKPINEQIHKINKLYDEGNTIIYWTARGTVTGINWFDLTKEQLDSWGCKYHDLRVGTKPHYDLWVDDKSKRIEEI